MRVAISLKAIVLLALSTLVSMSVLLFIWLQSSGGIDPHGVCTYVDEDQAWDLMIDGASEDRYCRVMWAVVGAYIGGFSAMLFPVVLTVAFFAVLLFHYGYDRGQTEPGRVPTTGIRLWQFAALGAAAVVLASIASLIAPPRGGPYVVAVVARTGPFFTGSLVLTLAAKVLLARWPRIRDWRGLPSEPL